MIESDMEHQQWITRPELIKWCSQWKRYHSFYTMEEEVVYSNKCVTGFMLFTLCYYLWKSWRTKK
jgi:hypothetical protein